MPTSLPFFAAPVTDLPLATASPASPTHSGLRVWQVAALVRAVADALEARFNPVSVSGEISGWQRAASGHCYFTLKDASPARAEGAMSVALFRRAAQMLDFEPRNGDVVELRGRLGVYEARGSLQIVAESMRKAAPKAETLWEQFERLKARLQAEGLFDEARKRPLPALVRGVAVVTSLQAAALQDVLTALARRLPHVRVWVFPASVQGALAPGEIVKALQQIEQTNAVNAGQSANLRPFIDAVLLVRGGGAMEDLWAFNDETVVRAIGRCCVPVVCGVGHETDFTLADFAADLRAPTPTAAAELLCQPTVQWLGELARLQNRLDAALTQRLERLEQKLDGLASRVARPASGAQAMRLQLERQSANLRSALLLKLQQKNAVLVGQMANFEQKMQQIFRSQHHRLDGLAVRLQAVNHTQVLQRGYALMTNAQGLPLTSIAQFEAKQRVTASLADGTVDLAVQGTAPH